MALMKAKPAGALEEKELERLRALLKANGLNPYSFARKIGGSAPYISRLFKGEDGATLHRWREICQVLGADIGYLFQDHADVPPLPKDPALIAATLGASAATLAMQIRALQEALQTKPPGQDEIDRQHAELEAAEARRVALEEKPEEDEDTGGPASPEPPGA